MSMSITRKRELQPKGRSWNEVSDMLARHIRERPQVLLCKQCRGEHAVLDDALTIHCACGAITRYQRFGLFIAWNSLTWTIVALAGGDTNPLRKIDSLLCATIILGELTNPQQPMDTRVHLWRLRASQ